MTERIAYRTFHFRPPLWRPTRELNDQTLVLIVGLALWLAFYSWLGWRLWSSGVERAGRLDVGLGITCVIVGIPLALGWWSVLRRWRTRFQKNPWPALSLEQLHSLTPSQ